MGYDYVRKLKAMMAKAESTTSSEEADAIMQKVQQMMAQHGVSLLGLETHLSDDPVAIGDPGLHFWKADGWARKLYAVVGELYGCRLYYQEEGNKTVVLVNGRESCRATFTLMAPYLFKSVNKLAAAAHRRGQYKTKSKARRDIGLALSYRLAILALEAQKAAGPRATAGMNALVPVDVLDVVEREAFGDMPTYRSRPGKRISNTGLLLANEINLAEQVGAIIDKDRLLA